MKLYLTLAHLYPDELNLYGDKGNIEAFIYRGALYGIRVRVVKIDKKTKDLGAVFKNIDIVFMGGGPDSRQKAIFKDFLRVKGDHLKKHIKSGKVGLFVCGAFQLLGKYYAPYSGPSIKGLGVFNFYTRNFGRDKPRCVGNVVVDISNTLIPATFSKYLVGFENHGGNTYLQEGTFPLGIVTKGFGNNREDKFEGVLSKNTIGTYLHGPILPRNPHLTDFLLLKAVAQKYGKSADVNPGNPVYTSFERRAHKLALGLRS